MSEEDLNSVLLSPFTFPKLPLDSNSVKRAACLVSDASSQVCGQEARHKYILSKIKARSIIPSFDTKSKFVIKEMKLS